MGFFQFFVKPLVDIPSWVGYDQIKNQSKFLGSAFRAVFQKVPSSPLEKSPTFEESMTLNHITEDDLSRLARNYFISFLIYFVVASAILGYALYLFFARHFFSGIISILIAVLAYMKAFASHYWYFEIAHRKFGCSVQEWLSGQIKQENEA